MPDITTPTNDQITAPADVPVMDYISQISKSINEADNILVTLSRNPSVDEITAALGLTIFLDKMGKHATAIYSGNTPNMLEFLKPEDTFETNTNSLQDFIVALNKAKADHLRYNVDGDYVKIFITPYKTTIEESDLEFSHGDYNVDLVIALNVPTVDDLDAALAEHGRILHDAYTVDITTGKPGKFGGIEWSNPDASSVSEMAANLVFAMQSPKIAMDASSATAFLTGIVAETNRFSNEKTTPSVMGVASELMKAGADQQLISAQLKDINITINPTEAASDVASDDPTRLNIAHSTPQPIPQLEVASEPTEGRETTLQPISSEEEVKAAAAETAQPAPMMGAVDMPTPGITEQPAPEVVFAPASEPALGSDSGMIPEPTIPTGQNATPLMGELAPMTVPESTLEVGSPTHKDYGKMIDDALAETTLRGDKPVEPTEPLVTNMAAESAPPVMNQPEANSVPQIDYSQVPPAPEQNAQPVPIPNNDVLPPPPPPPVSVDMFQEQAQTETQPAPEAVPQPVAEPAPQQPIPVPTAAQPATEPVPEATPALEAAPAPAASASSPEAAPTPMATPTPEAAPTEVPTPNPNPGMFQIPGV